MTEAQLMVLLMLIGSNPGTSYEKTVSKLENLIRKNVPQERLMVSESDCSKEIELVDYTMTMQEKLLVDFETFNADGVESCESEGTFCQAFFDKDKNLEKVNCRF